jgi:hypothetical protein
VGERDADRGWVRSTSPEAPLCRHFRKYKAVGQDTTALCKPNGGERAELECICMRMRGGRILLDKFLGSLRANISIQQCDMQ